MSDSNKPPKPPPDDFSKTTPNINIPGNDGSSDNDWSKTNYKYPAQPPSDDWGNTVANVRPFDNDADDFSKTFSPSSNSPKVPDWGVTQGNINLQQDDFGSDDSSGQNQEFGVTTPYFRLPEAERAKYQDIPPTPTEEAAEKAKEEKAKGGIPGWVWISGALFSMFMFVIVALLAFYIFFWKTPGFVIVVKNAPPGSSVRVDGSFWGETTADATKRLPVLKSGQRNIEIVHPNFECSPIPVLGQDGDVKDIDAKDICKQVDKPIPENCLNFKDGEFAKSRECAYTELGKLSDPPDIDALLRAMNLYINHFDSGKHDIRPEDAKFLQTAAGYMKKIPQDTVIEVGGHTDNVGTDATNQPLSERRANAVRDELIKAGIKESMLKTKGYGSKDPKKSNDTDDGKFQNRRIQYSRVK